MHQVLVFTKMEHGKALEMMRLDWKITSLPHPRYIYHAGKNYKETKSEVLATDLESWLGNRLDHLIDCNGAVTKEALESLIGEQADLQIVHIENDRYEAPFCHVKIVAPPGTLIADSSKEAA